MEASLSVPYRKFLTEIVACRIAESLDLKWLEDSALAELEAGRPADQCAYAALCSRTR